MQKMIILSSIEDTENLCDGLLLIQLEKWKGFSQVVSREKEYEHRCGGVVGLWGEIDWEMRLGKAVWDQIIKEPCSCLAFFPKKVIVFLRRLRKLGCKEEKIGSGQRIRFLIPFLKHGLIKILNYNSSPLSVVSISVTRSLKILNVTFQK